MQRRKLRRIGSLNQTFLTEQFLPEGYLEAKYELLHRNELGVIFRKVYWVMFSSGRNLDSRFMLDQRCGSSRSVILRKANFAKAGHYLKAHRLSITFSVEFRDNSILDTIMVL